MRHVLVETNWVVDVLAPRHRRGRAAVDLLERARRGSLVLHVPAFCLREGMATVQRKLQPRADRLAIRRFLRWAEEEGRWGRDGVRELEAVVSAFEQSVKKELTRAHLEARIEGIRETVGVEVFGLDETMVARLIELGAAGPCLGVLDEAVLAAVLERARALRVGGAMEVIFCETDSDLLPWSKKDRKRSKEPLSSLYREVGIEVVEGFALD